MRLTTLLLPTILLGSLLLGTAAAQPLNPPSGPVPADPYAQAAGPGDAYGPRAGFERRGRGERRERGMMRGDRGERGERGARAGKPGRAIRAQLIARFDRDGDGRLTGPERKRAKRFVMKHRRQLREQRQHQRGGF